MSGIKISVTDNGVFAMLAAMQTQLRDMTPVMRSIGRTLEGNVQVRFDTKTAPDGSPWAEWAPSTAAARAKEGRGTLLEFTGRMRDSLAVVTSRDEVDVHFGVPYAVHHENGTSRMPARPVLLDNGELGPQDRDDVLDAATRTLKRQLKLQGP